MSSEGDYTPRAGRPKPLTRKQLREMQERFAKVSDHLSEIKDLEKKARGSGHRESRVDLI